MDQVMFGNINFTGSSCTGKTSVYEVMKKDPFFEGYEFIGSKSREMVKDGYSMNENSLPTYQKMLFLCYMDLLKKEVPYISERCFIDVMAFTRALFDSKLNEENYADVEVFSLLTDRQRDQLNEESFSSLGTVFYFPPILEMKDDGERLVDDKLRKDFDMYIRHILRNFKVNFIEMIEGTVNERVDFIKDCLTKK